MFTGLLAWLVPARAQTRQPLQYTGVNIAGGEFYDPTQKPDPVYGRDFIYPHAAQLDYFVSKGINIIRLPFRWETLQRAPREALDPVELQRLRTVVQQATVRGLKVIIDPHNYARFYGRLIASDELPAGTFANFWARLAVEFANDPNVWFGLMNEPHDMRTMAWLAVANSAIAAIRGAGATNVILVPGNGWSNVASWGDNWYGTPNSIELLKIQDPQNNFLVEPHLNF